MPGVRPGRSWRSAGERIVPASGRGVVEQDSQAPRRNSSVDQRGAGNRWGLTLVQDTERDDTPGQFAVGFAFASLAALLGAVLWLIVAETFEVRLALIALGVSVVIGLVLLRFAPRDRRNAPTAIVLTFLSALVGLLASQYALLAQATDQSFAEAVLRVPFARIPRLLIAGTDAGTWLIVALSLVSGGRVALLLHNVAAAPSPPEVAPAPVLQRSCATASCAAFQQRVTERRCEACGSPTQLVTADA